MTPLDQFELILVRAPHISEAWRQLGIDCLRKSIDEGVSTAIIFGRLSADPTLSKDGRRAGFNVRLDRHDKIGLHCTGPAELVGALSENDYVMIAARVVIGRAVRFDVVFVAVEAVSR